MIITIDYLLDKYKEYKDPYGKINRDIKQEKLFPIVKGLYETNKNIDGYLLSSSIYGPSYLSFEYALYYYNLIPERVYMYTNATFNKRKKKKYTNIFGEYSYRDIPKEAFAHGVEAHIVNNYSYIIATKEKAICDMLYILEPQMSMKKLKILLFEDLRVDIDLFEQLDLLKMKELTSYYKSSNIKLLKKIIDRMM